MALIKTSAQGLTADEDRFREENRWVKVLSLM